MDFSDLITPDRVIAGLRAGSKKRALQALSSQAASITGLPEQTVFDTFIEREQLGTTGVGRGVAIPHAKFGGLSQLVGLFALLATPVDFEAPDNEPVDIIFMLLAPAEARAGHLKALARISRLMRNQDMVRKLRATNDPAALYALLTEPATSNAA